MSRRPAVTTARLSPRKNQGSKTTKESCNDQANHHHRPVAKPPPTDVHEALGLYQDIVCALEHLVPKLPERMLKAHVHSKETARNETDNLAHELRRARRGIKHKNEGYLNRGDLVRDIGSALEWSGVADIPAGSEVARCQLEQVLELIRPLCLRHGAEVAA